MQIVVGSVREGRVSGPVARWAARRFEERYGRPAELVDLRDWALPAYDLSGAPAMGPMTDRLQRAWATSLSRADAFVLVVPEYNHGPSAVLKNALDWAYAEWAGKPVAFVSFGNAGGNRAIQQLKANLGELRAIPIEPTVALRPFGRIADRVFSADDEEVSRLDQSFDELLRWQSVVGPLRTPPPGAPWRDRRVLVVGLDKRTNQGVVSCLAAAGVAADGHILGGSGDVAVDARGYDLVAIGRGAAGDRAAQVRRAVSASSPGTAVLEVLGPLAVRQVLSALDPGSPRIDVERLVIRDGTLDLRVSGDGGRVTVASWEVGPAGLARTVLATVQMRDAFEFAGKLAGRPYSVTVDLHGTSFHHHPVLP